MGTRHNIRVNIDGQIKVRQYGQWDGYPEGQGSDIARFLHEEMDKDKLKAALRECSFMTEQEITDFNQQHSDGEWEKTHPWLSRNAGAKVLGMIQEGSARKLAESKDDEDRDTWCEYLYLIDMDKEAVSIQGLRYHKENLTLPFSEWTVEAMKKLQDERVDYGAEST